MSTPKLVPYNVLPLWATDPNYPPGVEDWAASPTKQAPVANDFVPEEEFPAQQANHLFNGLTVADVGAKGNAGELYTVSLNRDVHSWAGHPFDRHAADTVPVFGNPSWDDFHNYWVSSVPSGSNGFLYAHPVGGGAADLIFRKSVEPVPFNNCDTVKGMSHAAAPDGTTATVLFNTATSTFGFRLRTPAGTSTFVPFTGAFAGTVYNDSGCDCFWSEQLQCFVFCIHVDQNIVQCDVGVFVYQTVSSTLTDITSSCGMSLPAPGFTHVRMFWQETTNKVTLAFGGNFRVPSVTVLTPPVAPGPLVVTNNAVGILATSGMQIAHVVGLAKANDRLYLLTVRTGTTTVATQVQLSYSTDFGTTWTVGATNNVGHFVFFDAWGFGNVGEALWMFVRLPATDGTLSPSRFRMFCSLNYGVDWEPVPAASLGNAEPTINANGFIETLGYTPKRGGMLALVDLTRFKSMIPNMQPTRYTLTL